MNSQLYKQFQKDGYLMIPDFIPVNLCNLLIDRYITLVNQLDISDIKSLFVDNQNGYINGQYFLNSAHTVNYFIDKNAFDEAGNIKVAAQYAINKLGHGLHEADPVFACFSQLYTIVHLLESLNVQNPTLLQSMYLCKQPFIGDEVACHQDETFIYLTKGYVVGLWFALEDATIENGCLWVIPGAHQGSVKTRMIVNDQHEIRMEEYDNTPWPVESMSPLEVKKGSVIVLHGLLPHMSKRNQSGQSRHAYTLHVKAKNQQLAVGNWLSIDGLGHFVQL